MLVLLILCLAKRNKKPVYYPELDGIVKETIGSTDIEGFGEKDMTQYDLKLLRVGPDGYLFNGELCAILSLLPFVFSPLLVRVLERNITS